MKQAKGRVTAWITACSLGLMALNPISSGAQTGFQAEPSGLWRLEGMKTAKDSGEEFIRYTEPTLQDGDGVVEAAARAGTVQEAESRGAGTQETGQQGTESWSSGEEGVSQGTESQSAGEEDTVQGTEPQASGQESASQGTESQSAGQESTVQGTESQSAGQENAVQGTESQSAVQTGGPQISSPSAILMEASTGQVIYEKNADEKRSPASITKIMTLILIFDALESGKIQMTDQVATSAYAKSMGGSQVFLEEGEVQTVETLIKCIVVASGNDASVAMAEYIAGDEKTFVDMMNQRAQGLGMTNTHFEDCCGLTESQAHVTSARDIAIMSRELINHYPQIHNYSTIWMDTITHVTKQGTKEFGLANTNKLLKMATNFKVTGLKTGSTSIAKYCLSATAEKDGVRLIAAVMAAPDYRIRFADANTLLNYGYANCRVYEDKEPPTLPMMTVDNGVEEQVPLQYGGIFSYLGLNGEDFSKVERNLLLEPSLTAPVELGQKAGTLEYWLNGKKLGEISVLTAGSMEAASYKDYFKKMLRIWGYCLLGTREQ